MWYSSFMEIHVPVVSNQWLNDFIFIIKIKVALYGHGEYKIKFGQIEISHEIAKLAKFS